MARGKTTVRLKTVEPQKNQILNAILSSKAFKGQADKKLGQKAAKMAADHVERHFKAAVSGIAQSLEGVAGGSTSLQQMKVATEAGTIVVKFPPDRAGRPSWAPLAEGYRDHKGHDFFWSYDRLVHSRFVSSMVAGYTRKKFTSYSVKMTRKPGQPLFDLTLSVELKKLPNPYDELVRRPFVNGVRGGSLPKAPAFKGTTRRARLGLNRILWPENQRPLLRPLAYRMGRLTLQTLRKTLEL